MRPTESHDAKQTPIRKPTGGATQLAVNRELLSTSRRNELIAWYSQMVLIRRFEEAAAEMYTRAKIGGYLHLNIGEEAAVVGAIQALQPKDYIFTSYREHGYALARGIGQNAIMAELFGKATGVCKGRGGSMHLYDAEKHFLGGYAIVGGSLPLALGVALAIHYRDGDCVVLSVFGEGATNIGAFNESMNLAAIWDLPIVFYCVNNLYAMGKAVNEDTAVPEIWRKACAYNMAAERVDGMNVLSVHDAVSRAVGLARQEHKPSLVESTTYRFRGHSMADAGRYRSADEVQEWMARDPITVFRGELEQAGLMDEPNAHRINEEAERAIDEALRFAEESPFPAASSLYEDVYCEPDQHKEA